MQEKNQPKSEEDQKKDIIFNHSPEGIKKALEAELDKAEKDKDFLEKKMECIKSSIYKLS